MILGRFVLLSVFVGALTQLSGCGGSELVEETAARDASADSQLAPERQLIKAAQRGDLESVETLLSGGIDVNASPALGITALWQACWSGHSAVAQALLRHGADPNVYDDGFQRSPLMLAKDSELITSLVAKGATDAPTQLCQAALDGSTERVAAILAGRTFAEDELVVAKANAELIQHARIAELLDAAAGRRLPQLPEVNLDRCQALVGDYRDAKLSVLQIRLHEGELMVQVEGSDSEALLPIDTATFQRGETVYRFQMGADGFAQVETSIASRVTAVYTKEPMEDSKPADALGEVTRQQVNAHAHQDDDAAGFDTWPQFRGHLARGIAREQDLPSEFSTQRNVNVSWIRPIPGLGNSSPIVWKDRLFLTTAVRESGSDQLIVGDYNDAKSSRDDASYTWKLYCLDSITGQEVWNRVASTGVPVVGRHPKSSYANPTPVTNGSCVVALFNSGDLQCFTMDGELLWQKHLGALRTGAVPEPDFEWGFASSPIIYDRAVIVQCDLIDESYVAAYDLETGSPLWRTARDEPPAWGTPLVFEGTDSPELVTSGSNFIRGYNLRTGQERWRLPGMSATTVPTPQYWHRHLFVASGHLPKQPILAIRTEDDSLRSGTPNLAWSHDRGGPYVVTPLVYRGYLYVCSTNGVLSCFEATTGQRIYRQRIAREGANSFSASPVAADGRIYFTSETGAIVEVQAGRRFSVQGVHVIGDYCMATPAIAGGRLFVRTRHGLVAISNSAR